MTARPVARRTTEWLEHRTNERPATTIRASRCRRRPPRPRILDPHRQRRARRDVRTAAARLLEAGNHHQRDDRPALPRPDARSVGRARRERDDNRHSRRRKTQDDRHLDVDPRPAPRGTAGPQVGDRRAGRRCRRGPCGLRRGHVPTRHCAGAGANDAAVAGRFIGRRQDRRQSPRRKEHGRRIPPARRGRHRYRNARDASDVGVAGRIGGGNQVRVDPRSRILRLARSEHAGAHRARCGCVVVRDRGELPPQGGGRRRRRDRAG